MTGRAVAGAWCSTGDVAHSSGTPTIVRPSSSIVGPGASLVSGRATSVFAAVYGTDGSDISSAISAGVSSSAGTAWLRSYRRLLHSGCGGSLAFV